MHVALRAPTVNDMDIERTATRLQALGNASRLAIYRTLVRAGRAGLSVGAVQERTNIPASTLSHHLRTLIVAGLVHQQRQGTTLRCSIDTEAMRATLGDLMAECCADATLPYSEVSQSEVALQ